MSLLKYLSVATSVHPVWASLYQRGRPRGHGTGEARSPCQRHPPVATRRSMATYLAILGGATCSLGDTTCRLASLAILPSAPKLLCRTCQPTPRRERPSEIMHATSGGPASYTSINDCVLLAAHVNMAQTFGCVMTRGCGSWRLQCLSTGSFLVRSRVTWSPKSR